MPNLNLQIGPNGPIIDVIVGCTGARKAMLAACGQTVPADIPCRLLIDTGAARTTLCTSLIGRLGLQPTGAVPAAAASAGQAPAQMPTYEICLTIQFPGIAYNFDAAPVVGTDFTAQGIQGLLGRDRLAQALLTYHGDLGWCTLSF